ncbi:tyrosine-type recombinase/integrase [Marivita sp. S2033]|uniref:tyrosine-type recombinase/integrase n=1 Tax=Marivita sp. S2033 TaxID=3373187 RepID=UPI0039827C4A
MTKRRGLHPDKALSALKVRQVTKAGRYSDGQGLYLVVSDTGAKRWMLRIMVHGRRRDMGLGGANLVTLADARQLAVKYRTIARNGGNPLEERRKERATTPTFAEAARQVHSETAPTWKNPKHAQQWINTLETYAVPHIGNLQLDHIKSGDVLRVLSPIWLEKPETARRVRQRLKTVFDWAKASGFRTTDNPVDGIERGLPKQTAKVEHHAAMPFADVPAFVQGLQRADKDGLITRRAFELLILTATRTSEVLKADWSEFDLEEGLWVIPAERMKMEREHRIPLPQRALEIVEEVSALGLQGSYVFPGTKPKRPMSNMAFAMMLRRLEVPFTAHGFRSSFRDWVAETTDYPNELAEMALAHSVGNKVEAAYRRGDMLDRRRAMMEKWASYLNND